MKKTISLLGAFLVATLGVVVQMPTAFGQIAPNTSQHALLRLVKTIPLPNVEGRIDHMSFDLENQRLFVAALGNNTVEVVDIRSGKVLQTIKGLARPQGVLYLSAKKRLFVANAADGTVRIFDGPTFQPLRSIALGDDADNIRLDAAAQRIYVGYG